MSEENNLLSRMEELINAKFQTFEQRINSTQRELSQAQLTAIQENLVSDGYTFKKKGHEQQFKVNAKVLDKMQQADGYIQEAVKDSSVDAAESARQKIVEGMNILNYRQKCIKLADSSEHGWKVVQEYESNPLADDDEDEKKIARAQIQADRKVRQERRLRAARFGSYPFFGRNQTYYSSVSGSPGGQAAQQQGRSTWTSSRKPGSCFKCGRPGHWRADCRARGMVESTQTEKSDQISKILLYRKNVNFAKTDSVSKLNRTDLSRFDHINAGHVASPEVVSPVGRLKKNIEHWKEVCSNEFIIDVIDQGYKLPFMNFPATIEIQNNSSALDNPVFVSAEIQNLVAKGCVSEVQSAPTVVNPLTVAFNRKQKARLVLDCRHVNPTLFKFKFRYEDQSVARQFFHKGDYMFSFDIKSAYHHIMIYQAHRTYLGFHWTQNGQKKYYVFNVLPFGISTAGFIFTKVLRVLVEKWRSLGLKVVLFLDDGLGGNHTRADALRDSSFVRQDLMQFGFLIAEEKCNWQPCLFLTWLGYVWDTEHGVLRVTEERLERTIALIEQLVLKVSTGQVLFPARALACLTGQLLSMQCVIGPVSRLRSMSLYQCIQSKASWNAPVKISSEVLSELMFWKENLRSLNMCNFELIESVENASVSFDFNDTNNVFVDASGSGFGSYIENVDDSQVIGTWSESEQFLCSTWRELEAVRRSIFSSLQRLQKSKVVINSDNKNVCSILKVGSNKPYLNDISVQIFDVCRKHDISVFPRWIPRAEMEERIFELRVEIVRMIKHPAVLQLLVPHIIDQTKAKEIKRLYEISTERANHRLIDLLIQSNAPGKWTAFQDALKISNYPYLATLLQTNDVCYTHQRRILELFAPFLEQEINPNEVIDQLYHEDVIDQFDREEIVAAQKNSGAIAASMLLLERIQTHLEPDKWFTGFLDALYDNSYKDLVRNIDPDYFEKKQLGSSCSGFELTASTDKNETDHEQFRTETKNTGNGTISENINRFWPVITQMLDLPCVIDVLVPAVISYDKRSRLLQEYNSDRERAIGQFLDDVITTENGVAFVQVLERTDYPYLGHLLRKQCSVQHNTYCEKVVQMFAPEIQYQISICDIIPHLVEEGVINQRDAEIISSAKRCKGDTAAAIALLDCIPSRLSPEDWYCKFLEILMKTSHAHVVKIMEPDYFKNPHNFTVKIRQFGEVATVDVPSLQPGDVVDEEIALLRKKKELYMKSKSEAEEQIDQKCKYMKKFVSKKCEELRQSVEEKASDFEADFLRYEKALLHMRSKESTSDNAQTRTETELEALKQQFPQFSEETKIEVKFERSLFLHFFTACYVTEVGHTNRMNETFQLKLDTLESDNSSEKSSSDQGSAYIRVTGLPSHAADTDESVIVPHPMSHSPLESTDERHRQIFPRLGNYRSYYMSGIATRREFEPHQWPSIFWA